MISPAICFCFAVSLRTEWRESIDRVDPRYQHFYEIVQYCSHEMENISKVPSNGWE